MKKEWTNWRKANYVFFESKLKNLSTNLRLFDLGSGPEQFANLFHTFVYTAVDFEKFNEKVLVADLTKKFPLEDSVADIITLSNTLEHIPNPEHFVIECGRILKTGGIIIGTVPFLLGVHQAPYDFNRYTPFQLKRFLEMSHFVNIEVVPLGAQMDVYNTIELKVFDELRKQRGGVILEIIRLIRRIEMRAMRMLFTSQSGEKVTEGYGFYAVKK